MNRITRIIALLLFTIATILPVVAQDHPESERDYDASIRRPIRRLHPEREREKAMKAYQKQQAAKADDPWADSTATKMSAKEQPDKRRVVGRRAQPQPATDKPDLQELLNKDYSLVQIVPEADKPYAWVDEPVQSGEDSLLARVSRTAQGAAIRYMPKGASMENTKNAFYLYFDERAAIEPLRLRVQYYADDPLDFNRIDFEIDGYEYSYTPAHKRSGHVYGRMIWENSDEAVTTADKDLLYALTHCQWVRMSLVGREGVSHVKLLSDEQIQGLRAVLQLYLLKGGRI
ncbi:MAG: hypothetical protein IJT30_12105 [Muribaculaceae bacterium]|nr:hypothetical protein [Muribaculaceae bacterium]